MQVPTCYDEVRQWSSKLICSLHTDETCLFNSLDSKGNYGPTSNNTKLVGLHWPLMVGVTFGTARHGPGRSAAAPSPLRAVPNVTAHPSTASAPITVLLYHGPLLCGFNMAIKGLK